MASSCRRPPRRRIVCELAAETSLYAIRSAPSCVFFVLAGSAAFVAGLSLSNGWRRDDDCAVRPTKKQPAREPPRGMDRTSGGNLDQSCRRNHEPRRGFVRGADGQRSAHRAGRRSGSVRGPPGRRCLPRRTGCISKLEDGWRPAVGANRAIGRVAVDQLRRPGKTKRLDAAGKTTVATCSFLSIFRCRSESIRDIMHSFEN